MYHLQNENKETDEFSKLKEIFNINQDHSSEFSSTICLLKELNTITTENCSQLQNQLKEITDNGLLTNNVNALYAQVKDDFTKLQDDYETLQNEYTETKLMLTQNINKLNEVIIDEKKKTDDVFREKCVYYEHMVDILKSDQATKEIEMNNKLYSSEASADLRYDDMQSQMQNAIDNVSKKLRESNNSNHILRQELMTLKHQHKFNLTAFEKSNLESIRKLEDKLLFTEHQLRKTQEQLFENQQLYATRNLNTKINSNISEICDEIPSLDVTNNITSSKPIINTSINTEIHSTNTPNDSVFEDFADSSAFLGANKTDYKSAWFRRKTGTVFRSSKMSLNRSTPTVNNNKNSTVTSDRDGNNKATNSVRKDVYNIGKNSVSTVNQTNIINSCIASVDLSNSIENSITNKNLAFKPNDIGNKKRKLYNPENLDYLNTMTFPE